MRNAYLIMWAVGSFTGTLGSVMQKMATDGILPYWPTFAAYGALGVVGCILAAVFAARADAREGAR